MWFGGLEFTDVRAIAKVSQLTWLWITEDITEVMIFYPSGEQSRVQLRNATVGEHDVVSIYDGSHFNSYVHQAKAQAP